MTYHFLQGLVIFIYNFSSSLFIIEDPGTLSVRFIGATA